ncbi:hypothetical protein [Methanosarcina sp.]|uniref:hypothetical protein n=1 Tax=Methanosarcina sp. TaxID=2213 RepID=UPI002ABBC93D|nr:hypothetical protein [Methanosarcina sp.]MDY9926421.1 hypothetical protein [Methanosarcina sp.]
MGIPKVRELDSVTFRRMGDTLSKLNNKILNLITLVSLLLLVYTLFILREIQPEGYSVSIYEQLPFHFFLILLFCYLSACFLILAFRKIGAVFTLILVHIIVLIIPYMLGYASVGRGDGFSYPVLAESTGVFGSSGFSTFSDLSPTGPLLVSALSLVSGMKVQALSYFLPVFFSLIFIAGMFLFYRGFMSREKLVSVTFLSSVIPYFGHFQVSTVPYYLTFCLVPLYLLLLWNAITDKNRKSILVCLLFMVPLLPLAHPFIFIYLVCFALLLAFSGKAMQSGFLKKILDLKSLVRDPLSSSSGRMVPLFIFLSFVSVGFLLYVMYTSRFFDVFLPALVWRIEAFTAAGFATIPSMEPGIFEFIHLFNLYYGKYYIPLIFVVINTVIVWQNRKRFCHHFVRRYPRFLFLYIISFLLELGFLLNPFIPYPPDRFANLSFIIFAQIPLLGYSLYIVLLRKGYTTGLVAAILVLALLWTLGFFSCFSSPYTGGISEAVTQNEVEGMQWLIESKAAYSYVISPGEKESYAFSETSTGSGSASTVDPQDAKSLNNQTIVPSYLVVTTFSEALNLEKSGSYDIGSSSVGNISGTPDNKSLYKIYDSLNIKIYNHPS